MHVLFCGSGWFPIIDAIAERLESEVDIAIWDRREPLVAAVEQVEVILASNGRIDAEVIHAATRLQLIQQPAAGVDNIDCAAAEARGIPVCNAPATNHVAVAEAALFLLLALARRLPEAQRSLAEQRIGVPVGRELRGRTLGIVGMGRAGSALADIARGLGMQVLGVSSSSTEDEFHELLAAADAVSLHCPLTPRTRGLIDAQALARMRPGAWLINCARGPIVDRDALIAALERGHLSGVGLDVLWSEPWDPADPLLARPDVVAMPHTAGSTRESFARIAAIVADNIERVRRGQEPLHRVV